jgi:hypothetical protein
MSRAEGLRVMSGSSSPPAAACLHLDYSVGHLHQHLPPLQRCRRAAPAIAARITVAAIQAEESKLLGHIGSVVHDLKPSHQESESKKALAESFVLAAVGIAHVSSDLR